MLIWAEGGGLSQVRRVPKGVRIMTHFDEAITPLENPRGLELLLPIEQRSRADALISSFFAGDQFRLKQRSLLDFVQTV